MKQWLNMFLSDLHKNHMKQLSFKKNHHTFSRDCGGYWERFNFQGSTSNGIYPDWKFYINVGIEFKDIEPRKYWSYFAHTHWADRIGSLVPTAPKHWNYNEGTNQGELMAELMTIIRGASEKLAAESEEIRRSYTEKEGKYAQ